MLNPKHSAFPQSLPSKDSEPLLGSGHDPRTGVNIRTWGAFTIAAGLLANSDDCGSCSDVVKSAVQITDMLIEELNKPQI